MDRKSIKEGTILWKPPNDRIKAANITQYMKWLKKDKGLDFTDYDKLWKWSVTQIEAFWESLWQFLQIKASKPYREVLSDRKMPGAEWFNGASLNYAEHVFHHMSPDCPALMFQSEIQSLMEISWDELYQNVSSIADSLRNMGVQKGDRIVSYQPNIPQTIIAFLACASIGAVWSSCSPDFGTRSVIDRFNQIGPKVLFAVDGYQYNGKAFDCRPAVAVLQQSLSTLENTVLVPYLKLDTPTKNLKKVRIWDELLKQRSELVFEQVPFSHPIWVVYSSGTTGLPKPLVHSHGGILLEFKKFLGLHMDIKPKDRFFWFSTTGWVMWNVLQGSLLMGATPLLYDGSPVFPDMDVIWDFAEKTKMTNLGTSAAYITTCMNRKMEPQNNYNLSKLKTVGSTGSPLSPEGFQWVYDRVKKDVLLGSSSGGTDPCTAFLGCCPLLPVRAGELQCRCLGVKAEAFDEDGNSLIEEVGELVITEPMPSMPLYLWNDPKKQLYIDSYFTMYPGKWRHGDWVKITSGGSCVILGRSDSTINRHGVRMGSSEIYNVVEEMTEVLESLVVGFNLPEGEYFMPLFVVIKGDIKLDDTLKVKIRKKIRRSLSPRHVPDEIYSVPEIPRTLNAKKLEVPVKKILSGIPPEKALNVDSMSNPKSINYFLKLGQQINRLKTI
ncbi:MAG: acetoacetate--CoA ligase [Desulfobacterales bacterium]|jgi:acetoacetyl-CoA synthetase|nr:acetoacetate--CoA ligase [Desulfobacterales bacterium]MDP6808677.1 acetoacetate--CoA ligase [Desulfobacterales bacterium]|tara:strand:+ start:1193 stop:3187 length:1995 start_codon:yes stop_codon:yes gene_type:complete